MPSAVAKSTVTVWALGADRLTVKVAMTTVPGLAPVIWDFSVWDESVATKVNALLGKKVQLHYREYRGLPTDCFGATDYFVDRVEPVE